MDIHARYAKLGPRLMCMHVLRGCETVSYPFSKGNISALNTLKCKADALGLFEVLGEEDATHSYLMETCQRFFAAMYVQSLRTTTSEARYRIYSRKKGRAYAHHAITPQAHLYLHVCSVHLQMMLRKAADQQVLPKIDIIDFC